VMQLEIVKLAAQTTKIPQTKLPLPPES